jgi:hypothetical protein
VQQSLKKLKIELPYNPAIPVLSMQTEELKSGSGCDISIPIIISALLTKSKI